MGILSFTKKSRKQGQRLPFALEEHIPSRETHNVPLQKPKEPPRHYFDMSSRRQSETSLMDDIMKELHTKDQPKVESTEKTKQSVQPLLRFNDAETYNPAVVSSEQYAETNPSTPTSQARPKPLISFANEQPDIIAMVQRDTIPLSDDTNSIPLDADDEPILSRQRQMKRHSITDVTHAHQSQQSASLVKTKQQTAKPLNRNIMDRMKERHRQEARMSLQAIPFIDPPMQQARPHPLSSPSMPIIYMNEKQSPSKPLNTLIQSPSFTPYSPPQNHLVRSASFATDIYGGKNYSSITIPTQAQPDINFRPAPTSPFTFMRTPSHSQINVRVGYQQAHIYTPSLQPENTFIEEPLQQEQRYLNRSSSAHLLSNQIHPLYRPSEIVQYKQENNKITETPSPPADKLKSKTTTTKKPLYERAISPERVTSPEVHHHHHHHHHPHHNKDYVETPCSPRASISKFHTQTNIPDTPPPESHSRHSVDTTMKKEEDLPPSPASIHSTFLPDDVKDVSEIKDTLDIENDKTALSEDTIESSKEITNILVKPITSQDDYQKEQELDKIKADDHSVVETVAASETSNKSKHLVTQDKTMKYPKAGVYRMFQLPKKLKQELQGVQMRKSSYSVPDLTIFTKQDNDSSTTISATHWSEIEPVVQLKQVEVSRNRNNINEKTKSIQTEHEEKPQESISHPRECISRTITPSASRIDLYSCCSNIPVSCCQRNSYTYHNGSDHHYCYSSQNHGCHNCSYKHSNHLSDCPSNNSGCNHKTKGCMKKSSSICSAMKLDHHSMMSHSPSQQHLHSHQCSKRRNKHRHSSDRHESSHRHHYPHSKYRLDENHSLVDGGAY